MKVENKSQRNHVGQRVANLTERKINIKEIKTKERVNHTVEKAHQNQRKKKNQSQAVGLCAARNLRIKTM